MMMKYLMIILFLAVTGVHLYASFRLDKPLRNKTKPFILLTLLGFYCFRASKISVTVVLALLFSWLGDVLLIPKGTKWFTAGGIAFMISHFFFILSYVQYINFALVNKVMLVILPILFAAVSCVIFHYLRPHLPKPLFYPMLLYLLINGTMNCFALFRLISLPCIATVITCIGAFLFFISDSTLFFVRFKKDGRIKTHFWVMLTYSIGELLIIIGLL